MTVHAPQQASQDDLLARAKTGDRVALADLMDQVWALAHRYARSRLRSYHGGAEAAEDVAQETCLGVFRALDGYRYDGSPFNAFVHSVAANKVADAQRGFGRAPRSDADPPECVEPSPSPESQVLAEIAVREAMSLLDELPAVTRDALLLRAEGVSAAATAERLGMTANAVRVMQHRGCVRLRRMLDERVELQELLRGA